MNSLVLNFLLYLITWIFLILKIRRFNLYIFTWTCFTLSSLMSIFAINRGIYYYGVESLVDKLSFQPYVLAYIFNLILCYPLYKFDERKINLKSLKLTSSLFSILIKVSFVLCIACSIVKITELAVLNQMNFNDIYSDSVSGEFFWNYSNPILQFLSGLGCSYCVTMAPVFFFYYVSRILNGSNKHMTIICIIITLFPSIIQPILGASRGGIFFSVFRLFIYYFIIRKYLTVKQKRSIELLSIVGVVILFSVSMLITEDRWAKHTQSNTKYDPVIEYFGEPNLNLGYVMWDNVKEHPMGQRLLQITPSSYKADNPNLVNQYWSKRTNLQLGLFKSAFGDLYVEFGTLGAFIFIIIYVFIWDKFVFRKYYYYNRLPLVVYYFIIVIYGLFSFKNIIIDKWFPVLILICIWIGIMVKNKKTISIIHS